MKKNKILSILIITIMLCALFSVTVFATSETQTTTATQQEVRYVTGYEVNIVFGSYILDEEEFPEKETVTKGQLYDRIKNSVGLSKKIHLDLYSNKEELITQEDLSVYLDIMERKDNEIIIRFSLGVYVIAIIFGLFLCMSISSIGNAIYTLKPSFSEKSDFTEPFEKIAEAIKEKNNKK